MKKKVSKCSRCGKCCYPRIPITIADLHKIAKHLKIADRDAFSRFIQHSKPKSGNLIILKKRVKNACIFLRRNSTCRVYKVRPAVCRFYRCGDAKEQTKDIFSESPANQRRIWKYSQFAGLTRQYTKKNGARWVHDEYLQILKKQRKIKSECPIEIRSRYRN